MSEEYLTSFIASHDENIYLFSNASVACMVGNIHGASPGTKVIKEVRTHVNFEKKGIKNSFHAAVL